MPDNPGDGTPQGGNLDQQHQTPSGGGDSLGWRAQLPDDLKGNEAFTSFANVGEFGKAFLDLKGRADSAIPKLAENATPEQQEAYYKAIGRPDTPDLYKLNAEIAAKYPEGAYDPKIESWFRGLAHKIGLTNAQANAMYEEYAGMDLLAREQQRQQMDAARDALKAEWGDKAEENARIMLKAVDTVLTPEERAHFDKTGYGNDPVICKAFYRIGLEVLDDSAIHSSSGGQAEADGRFDYPSMKNFGK